MFKNICLDRRGGGGVAGRVPELGRQPDPDHGVHHGLPDPRAGVPRHHHLRPGTVLYCTVLYCTVLYPDLTICGQGMATDTLDKVLKERFENWMRSRGLDLNSESVTITSLCYYLVFDLILKGTSKTQVN